MHLGQGPIQTLLLQLEGIRRLRLAAGPKHFTLSPTQMVCERIGDAGILSAAMVGQ